MCELSPLGGRSCVAPCEIDNSATIGLDFDRNLGITEEKNVCNL